jgi:hypothetical protein
VNVFSVCEYIQKEQKNNKFKKEKTKKALPHTCNAAKKKGFEFQRL